MSGMTDMSSTSGGGSMDMKMYFHGSIGTDMLWFESWMPTSAGATVGVCIGVFLLALFERYLVAFRKACDAGWYQGQTGFIRPTTSGTVDPDSRLNSPARYSANPQTRLLNEIDNSLPNSPFDPRLQAENGDTDQSSDKRPTSVPLYTPGSSSSDQFTDEKDQTSAVSRVAAAKQIQQRHQNISHLPAAVRRGLTHSDRRKQWSRPFQWSIDLPRGLLQSLQTLIHYLLMLVVMTFQIWWILAVVVGAGVGEMLFGRFGPGGGAH